ncbi:MAG: SEC-C domain-containing protein, partial [Gemmataceae bacterium]|nr:SEC-C domain-containing protein [Gemmataceae bacterium]
HPGVLDLLAVVQHVLVLDSEDQIAVLMDYCIYEVRRRGRTAFEQYLADSPPAPDSDEMVLLKAMQQAHHSLFLVEAAERGVGVTVRDLLRGDTHFIMDVGFSQTAQPGLVLAFRITSPENFSMTTGAALPVGMLPQNDREAWLHPLLKRLKRADFSNVTPQEATEVTTTLIRTCLERGAAEHVAYAEPGKGKSPGRAPRAAPPTPRMGRNGPCPCGSGKKFKHCCGDRR